MAEETASNYCSVHSLQAGEPLFATAVKTVVYLLLEYAGPWGSKAFEESSLPEDVKQTLNTHARKIPQARLLLIRQPRQAMQTGLRFFIAVAEQSRSDLYAFQLDDYQDLLDLDIPAIASGAPQYAGQRQDDSLILVCTNGRRDLCCSRFGVPVYKALAAASRDQQVWESSHMGGHRFAPNVLCLPQGLLYGRVTPQDGLAILDAQRAGQVHLPNLRGRTCYPEPVQAAEHYLRQHTGRLALEAFQLRTAAEIQPGNWLVQFSTPGQERIHKLHLTLQVANTQVHESCQFDKKAPIKHYRLDSYIVE
ncbi:MAG: sucrase ferredoxin [Chloroflexota bacterium]